MRAGGSVAAPVLDNDVSPAGDRLTLLNDLSSTDTPGQLAVVAPIDVTGDVGKAFVSGRVVRYVAPEQVEERDTYTVTYVAQNLEGKRADGTLKVTVVPADDPNDAPEPPTLEGRVVSGDTVKVRVPGVGVDRNGDPVTVTGITSAPRLGRIEAVGGNFLEYEAYPRTVGTDEFTYSVVDSQGAFATGTVRVAVVEPGQPQPPLAVEDRLTVEPGRTATFDPLANDFIAPGDSVEVEILDGPDGARLDPDTNLVTVPAPDSADAPPTVLVYRVTNGIDESRATMTLDHRGRTTRTRRSSTTPSAGPTTAGAWSSTSSRAPTTRTAPSRTSRSSRSPVTRRPGWSTGCRSVPTVARRPRCCPSRCATPTARPPPRRSTSRPPATACPTSCPGRSSSSTPGRAPPARSPTTSPRPTGARCASRPAAAPTSASPTCAHRRARRRQPVHAVGPGGLPRTGLGARRGHDRDRRQRQRGRHDDRGRRHRHPLDPGGGRATTPRRSSAPPASSRCRPASATTSTSRPTARSSPSTPATPTDLDFSAEWSQAVDGVDVSSPAGLGRARSRRPTTPPRAARPSSSCARARATRRRSASGWPRPRRRGCRRSASRPWRPGRAAPTTWRAYLEAGVANPDPRIVTVQNTGSPGVKASVDGSRLTLTADRDTRGAEASVPAGRQRRRPTATRRPRARPTDGSQFTVIGTPSPPGEPRPYPLSDEVGTIKMGWAPPDDDGGAPVLYYMVREEKTGAKQRCDTNECVFRKLKTGGNYSFRVQAFNRVGGSDWSNRVAVGAGRHAAGPGAEHPDGRSRQRPDHRRLGQAVHQHLPDPGLHDHVARGRPRRRRRQHHVLPRHRAGQQPAVRLHDQGPERGRLLASPDVRADAAARHAAGAGGPGGDRPRVRRQPDQHPDRVAGGAARGPRPDGLHRQLHQRRDLGDGPRLPAAGVADLHPRRGALRRPHLHLHGRRGEPARRPAGQAFPAEPGHVHRGGRSSRRTGVPSRSSPTGDSQEAEVQLHGPGLARLDQQGRDPGGRGGRTGRFNQQTGTTTAARARRPATSSPTRCSCGCATRRPRRAAR